MDKLRVSETALEGASIIESIAYEDSRGSFSRVFCQEEMATFFDGHIEQINHSVTYEKGTVRGLHFQYPPYSEIKMVKCIKGSIFDVIVDIRESSATFLHWFSTILSSENKAIIYIPKGFAHGFQTLEENTELLYLHSERYIPNHEGGLNVLDPVLNIKWPLPIMGLSERDALQAMVTEDFKGVHI